MTASGSAAAAMRGPAYAALAAGLGCAYLALNDPSDPGALMPRCPTKLLTGLDCPACGGLRMTRALLYGDVRAAARANVLLLLLAPAAVLLWVTWVRRARAGAPAPAVSRRAAYGLLAVALAWTLARNLA